MSEATENVETFAEESAPESAEQSKDKNPNAESAKWRTKLRETESALAAANERLAGFQRAELERLAAERLSAPGDLLTLSGKQLSDFLSDDGTVNAEAVNEAATAVLDARPGLAPSQAATDPTQGRGTHDGAAPRSPQWTDLFG